MTCLRESNKKWLRDNCLKLVDASMLQSIGRAAGDAGQCTRCSMSIATRNNFDRVHEMVSVILAITSKKIGLRSFSRDQERPAFLQKSSRCTWPRSKRHNFAIWHVFAVQFWQWTLPWTDWYAYQSNSTSTCWENWKHVDGQDFEFQGKLKGLIIVFFIFNPLSFDRSFSIDSD